MNIENNMEQRPLFKIEGPQIGEELAIASMHIKAWKESYVTPESGLTNEEIDELLAHFLTDTSFRKNTIVEAIAEPDRVFYRVIKNNQDEIVGFFHGSKKEDCNELEAIYLLNEAKGSGTGAKLMKEFLAWIDKSKPTRLEVFSFNKRAIGLYTKYGFVRTERQTQMWRDGLPYIEMIRPAELAQ